MIDLLTAFIVVSASISVIMTACKKLLGRSIYTHPVFVRMQPILPLILGIILSFFAFKELTTALQFSAGIMAGACSAHAYKIFKQSIKSEDVRLKSKEENEFYS